MGYMKQFAIDLATMVYQLEWKDNEIIAHYRAKHYDTNWIERQIKVVRAEPALYKIMVGAK